MTAQNSFSFFFFFKSIFVKLATSAIHWIKRLNPPPLPKNPQDIQGEWSLQDQSSCYKTAFYIFKLGVVTALVVWVCVVASPVALCDTSGGRLVADALAGSRRPPIRRVCVMSLPSGTGRLSLGVHSPPWMAVMGSGSALAVVWWIMMRVFFSLPEGIKTDK